MQLLSSSFWEFSIMADSPATAANAEVADMSSAQPLDSDMGKAKADIDGVWFKATEGVNYVDSHFHTFATSARTASLPFGAYHYFRVRAGKGIDGQDGRQQAEQFCNQYFAAGCTLPPMVDVEAMNNTVDSKLQKLDPQPTTEEWRAGLRQFCDVVMTRIGRLIIYTSKGEWESFGLQVATEFAQFDLWIAAVGVSSPHVPLPWKTWKLWQYTWSGKVSGVSANGVLVNVDKSKFAGTPEGFRTWAGIQGATIAGAAVAGAAVAAVAYGGWRLWQILRG